MLPLGPDEAHVWFARRTDGESWDFQAVLSPCERERANKLRSTRHQATFIFAHAVLRDVLSRYLGCPATGIVFRKHESGKPYIYGPDPRVEIEFSLSHSADLVLIGICSRRIGADIELNREIADLYAIAQESFTPTKRAEIFSLPSEERSRAFLRYWTRKEAFVKAIGGGLSVPLNSFEVEASSEGSNASGYVKCAQPLAPPWRWMDLETPEDS